MTSRVRQMPRGALRKSIAEAPLWPLTATSRSHSNLRSTWMLGFAGLVSTCRCSRSLHAMRLVLRPRPGGRRSWRQAQVLHDNLGHRLAGFFEAWLRTLETLDTDALPEADPPARGQKAVLIRWFRCAPTRCRVHGRTTRNDRDSHHGESSPPWPRPIVAARNRASNSANSAPRAA